MDRIILNLLEDTEGRIAAIYYCPSNEGRQRVLLLEMNLDKRYLRVWLDSVDWGNPVPNDWTWSKPDDAIQVA